MKSKKQILLLKQSAERLQESPQFPGLAVLTLAVALEKQVKNVVIFNYRKSGLSASFVRMHLIEGVAFSGLLSELDWGGRFIGNKKIKQVWKEAKPPVKDLFRVMKTRNRLIHSNGGVSAEVINASVLELLAVIEKLAEIFEENFRYTGLEPLPTNIKAQDLNVNTKLFHKAVSARFGKK
jgi:hypothetical protein